MPYYQQLGSIPHKRHTQFRQPDASLYHEELIGMEGFSGEHSLLYHRRPPTEIESVKNWESIHLDYAPLGALSHRHLKSANVTAGGDGISARIPLLANDDICISVARPTAPMPYWYRFAEGDEIIFIHAGQGVLESQFGLIHYRRGDYLIIPAGVLWRLVPDRSVGQRLLMIETYGHITPPKRYLSEYGQFLEASPYCERDIRAPEKLLNSPHMGSSEIHVKTREGITSYVTSHTPLDVVGWAGHLWPYALNIHDFEPITGRIHQPPSVHQTFTGPNFVVCSFVPRLFDYHPESIPAPYNHSNVDSTEVLYYVDGQFMSRRGIEPGSITVHPGGLPHGPQPGLYEASIGKSRTEELAVMIDTFHPLRLTTQAATLEVPEYIYSWRSSTQEHTQEQPQSQFRQQAVQAVELDGITWEISTSNHENNGSYGH